MIDIFFWSEFESLFMENSVDFLLNLKELMLIEEALFSNVPILDAEWTSLKEDLLRIFLIMSSVETPNEPDFESSFIKLSFIFS